MNRFVVVGACSKERIEVQLRGALATYEACLSAHTVPLEQAVLKVVVDASGALKPAVIGVENKEAVTCLVSAMATLNIKKTGPGMCLVRWGLR